MEVLFIAMVLKELLRITEVSLKRKPFKCLTNQKCPIVLEIINKNWTLGTSKRDTSAGKGTY